MRRVSTGIPWSGSVQRILVSIGYRRPRTPHVVSTSARSVIEPAGDAIERTCPRHSRTTPASLARSSHYEPTATHLASDSYPRKTYLSRSLYTTSDLLCRALPEAVDEHPATASERQVRSSALAIDNALTNVWNVPHAVSCPSSAIMPSRTQPWTPCWITLRTC